jgi:hypothetical protein
LGLKKYRRGTGRVSKTSDNEHTTASLGHSEELSVKHPVGPPIPEVGQGSEDRCHVCAWVAAGAGSCGEEGVVEVGGESPSGAIGFVTRRKQARDVLDENPTGSELSNETHELME